MFRSLASALLLVASIASPACAARYDVGGHLIIASATGGFADVAGVGVGLQAFGVRYLGQSRILGLRGEAGFLNYGSHEYPRQGGGPAPGFTLVRVTGARDNIGLFTVGPQLKMPGGRVRPFGYGLVGIGVFTSRTVAVIEDVGGMIGRGIIDRTSVALAWGGGGGVAIPIGSRISIDAATEYRAHHNAEYVPPGGVTADPETGVINLGVHKGDANVLVFKLGVCWSPAR